VEGGGTWEDRRGEVGGKVGGKIFGAEKRRKKQITLGREDVLLVHPKMASTASSSTGALVGAGSLQPG